MLLLQVVKDWRLNERHYGGLTGLDKAQCVKEYGKEQVRKCGAFKTTKSATFPRSTRYAYQLHISLPQCVKETVRSSGTRQAPEEP